MEVHVCNVTLNPRPKFTGTHVCINYQGTREMFHFSCSALRVPGTVVMFPVCPTQVYRDAAFPILEIKRAGIHPQSCAKRK